LVSPVANGIIRWQMRLSCIISKRKTVPVKTPIIQNLHANVLEIFSNDGINQNSGVVVVGKPSDLCPASDRGIPYRSGTHMTFVLLERPGDG
jgi:hypothetical protein